MYAENTFLRNTLSVGYCVFHTPILWGLSVGAMSRHHFHRGVFRWQCGIHTRRLMVDIWICNRFRLSKVTLPHLSTYVLKLERSPTIGAKGRVQKKMRERYGLLPNQGGGSPRVIKNQTPFLEKYFFSELVESF